MTTDPPPSHALAFHQYRLSRFGLWGFVITAAGLSVRAVIDFTLGQGVASRPWDYGGHALAGIALGLLWLGTMSRRRLTRPQLIAAESVGLNLATVGLCVMAAHLPLSANPMMVLVLGLTITFTLRSVYVPSTWQRSLVLSLCAGAWMVVTALVLAETIPDGPQRHGQGRGMLITTVVWWSFSSLVLTLASHVIYGLRQQVREAEQLGQYKLEERLGQGGMGVVYRARHAMLRRPTAVKLLPPDHSGDDSIERFEREVRRTASLSHPSIVTIFDYGRTPDGVFYYAMELLDGLDLDQLVGHFGPQPPSRVVHVLAQICDGLEEAHSVGLIHRDIKPANIFLVRQRRGGDLAKLVDFGLVKDQELGPDVVSNGDALDADGAPGDVALTTAGAITGTPQYLSPEAIERPGEVDARSDLYAVGAVAYFLLTGEHVFSGETIGEVCAQHLQATPVAPSKRLGKRLPEALEELVLYCLEKDPENRPQTADELRDLLLTLEDVPLWSTRQARIWWKESEGALASFEGPALTVEPAPTLQVDLQRRRGPIIRSC